MQKLSVIPKGNSLLIDGLIAQRVIKSKAVEEVLKSIDRADFCDTFPYEDRPQGIGFSATISAPHMHAYALEYLKDHLLQGKKSLDVGSGSGYLTLAFAKMQEKAGGVAYGIEHIPALVELSRKNINKNHADYLKTGKIVIIEGDGRLGLPLNGPYNCIHVGAGEIINILIFNKAAKELHTTLVEQLAPLGRMVIPVDTVYGGGQDYLVVDKSANGEIVKQKVLGVNYVPLTSKEHQCPSSYFKI